MPITFVQPLSLPSVFFLVVAIATFFFILRIIKVRIFQFKLQLDNLPNLPTVLIVGAPMAGKSSLFSRFADREKILSVSNYAIGLAKLSDGKFLQLIDPPRVIPPADGESLREKVNLVLFVFDGSKDSLPISTQLSFWESLKKRFENVPFLPIINTKGMPDNKKIKELNKIFSFDIPKISIKDGKIDTIENLLSKSI